MGETSPRGDIKEDTSSLIRFWILFFYEKSIRGSGLRKPTEKLLIFTSYRLKQKPKYYLYTLLQIKVSARLFLCGATRSTPRLLSYVKKVGKDTPKTSWFLDFQQKGGPPFDPPSGESSLSRFSRAMTVKAVFY